VGLFAKAGSRFETVENAGVAAVFGQIAGSHGLQASVSRERVALFATAPRGQIAEAVQKLHAAMSNITEEAVDSAREQVLREQETSDDRLDEVTFDRLHETAYRGTSLATTPLGTAESVKALRASHVQNFLATHFTGARAVLAASGADHQEFVNAAEQTFGKLPAVGAKPATTPAHVTGSDLRIRHDGVDYAHVAYGFPVAGSADVDTPTLLLISSLLGGFDKTTGPEGLSKLVRGVVQGDLVQSLRPFHFSYGDSGLFGVYTVANADCVEETQALVTEEFARLPYHVDERALADAKNRIKAALAAQQSDSLAVAGHIGAQILSLGRRVAPADLAAQVDALTPKHIKATAQRFFLDRDFVLSAVGPIYELPDYHVLRSRTFKLI